jgi:hypothetical protein
MTDDGIEPVHGRLSSVLLGVDYAYR